MSFSGGQIFGAVIGAAAVALFPPLGAAVIAGGFATTTVGAAMFAATIGMTIGGIIDPPEQQTITQEGARLGDLSAQTATWGAPVRRLFGKFRLAGNVIWALDLHETKHVEESGDGKGGAGGTKTETIWYSYAGSWAVAFCEGPVTGVSKIWLNSVLVYDGTNYSGGLTAENHHIHLGTKTQNVDWYIQAHDPDTPAYRNMFYIVFNSIELENYGNKVPKVDVETYNELDTVDKAASALLERSGVSTEFADTSDGTDVLAGYVVTQPMSTRAALEPLITAYQLDLIEEEFGIVLRKRTVPENPVVVNDVINFVQIERKQTVELSKIIHITYANKDKNYDAGSQLAQRIDVDTVNVKSYQYALALTDTQAKQIAETYIFSEWNERLEFIFSLPSTYMDFIVGQVIQLDYKGLLHTVRIRQIDYSANSMLSFKASLEDLSVYSSIAIGSDTNNSYTQDTVKVLGATNMELLDIPMLDNAYNAEGIYIAAEGVEADWNGSTISRSTDDQVTYNQAGQIVGGTYLGTSVTALADGISTLWDTVNTVTISLTHGNVYSKTEAEVLLAENYILIGDEILQFRDVSELGGGEFELSYLLRGRRGTEWSTNLHVVGERVVVLDSQMIFDASAALNVGTYYKATTFGLFLEDSIEQFIQPKIRCLKPLSPSYVKGVRDVSNNLTITWMRRSRDVTGYFKALSLYEESESYEVDIITGTGRTISSSSEEVVYTAVDQIADGITLGDAITIDVFQISGTVQRGYATREIV